MKNKTILKLGALVGCLSPVITTMACGSASTNNNDIPFENEVKDIANQTAEWMLGISETNKSFADFPDVSLNNPIMNAEALSLIYPINKPEVPLEAIQTQSAFFVVNKNNLDPNHPSVEIEYIVFAGAKTTMSFSKYYSATITKFNQMLDLSNIATSIMANPQNDSIRPLISKTDATSNQIINALNEFQLSTLKESLFTIEQADIETPTWTLLNGDAIPSSGNNLKNNQTSYKATITASSGSSKVKNAQEVVITIPPLDIYDAVQLVDFTANNSDLSSLSSITVAPKQQLESIVKTIIFNQLKNSQPNVKISDFELMIQKTTKNQDVIIPAGFLDLTTNLTTADTILYVQLFPVNRNNSLVSSNTGTGFNLTIPKLT